MSAANAKRIGFETFEMRSMRGTETIGVAYHRARQTGELATDSVEIAQLDLRCVQCSGKVQASMASTSPRIRPHNVYRPPVAAVLTPFVPIPMLPLSGGCGNTPRCQ